MRLAGGSWSARFRRAEPCSLDMPDGLVALVCMAAADAVFPVTAPLFRQHSKLGYPEHATCMLVADRVSCQGRNRARPIGKGGMDRE